MIVKLNQCKTTWGGLDISEFYLNPVGEESKTILIHLMGKDFILDTPENRIKLKLVAKMHNCNLILDKEMM